MSDSVLTSNILDLSFPISAVYRGEADADRRFNRAILAGILPWLCASLDTRIPLVLTVRSNTLAGLLSTGQVFFAAYLRSRSQSIVTKIGPSRAFAVLIPGDHGDKIHVFQEVHGHDAVTLPEDVLQRFILPLEQMFKLQLVRQFSGHYLGHVESQSQHWSSSVIDTAVSHLTRYQQGFSYSDQPSAVTSTKEEHLPPGAPSIYVQLDDCRVFPVQGNANGSSDPVHLQVNKTCLVSYTPGDPSNVNFWSITRIFSFGVGDRSSDHVGIVVSKEQSSRTFACHVFRSEEASNITMALQHVTDIMQTEIREMQLCSDCPLTSMMEVCRHLVSGGRNEATVSIVRLYSQLTHQEEEALRDSQQCEGMSDKDLELSQRVYTLLQVYMDRQKAHNSIVKHGLDSASERRNSTVEQKSSFFKILSTLAMRSSEDPKAFVSEKETGVLSLKDPRTLQVQDDTRPRSLTSPENLRKSFPHHHPSKHTKTSSGDWTSGMRGIDLINFIPRPASRRSSRSSTHISRQMIFDSVKGQRIANSVGTIHRKTPITAHERWKMAVHQVMLHKKMEIQNDSLSAVEIEHSKQSYKTLIEASPEVRRMWGERLNKLSNPVDTVILLNHIQAGVPKAIRGLVWLHLVDQHCLRRNQHVRDLPWYHYYSQYKKDMRRVCVNSGLDHQSIIKDLARTFPEHRYFSPLGFGVGSLYRVLMAYASYDPELGYCQGMNFIAALLLIHLQEEDAFRILCFLMYEVKLRKKYIHDLPGMFVEFFQVMQLLYHRHEDLFSHLQKMSDPALYTSWSMSFYGALFPVGFCIRVVDFVLLQGCDFLPKVTVSLLGHIKEDLLKQDSVEDVAKCLKVLPLFSGADLDGILLNAASMDVSVQLKLYETEYQVLTEVEERVNQLKTKIEELVEENRVLVEQNHKLRLQLGLTNGGEPRSRGVLPNHVFQ